MNAKRSRAFVWLTNDCQALTPAEMTTLHLFHSVRMLWNHTVSPTRRLEPFREWSVDWDADFRAEAMVAFSDELNRRSLAELTQTQRVELKTILKGSKAFDKAFKALAKREKKDLIKGLKSLDLSGDWQSFYWGWDNGPDFH